MIGRHKYHVQIMIKQTFIRFSPDIHVPLSALLIQNPASRREINLEISLGRRKIKFNFH